MAKAKESMKLDIKKGVVKTTPLLLYIESA
jgi:hypothetical protein